MSEVSQVEAVAENAAGDLVAPSDAATNARARLTALYDAGAAHWDAPGLRLIDTLLTRAAEHPGALGERLHERAAAHLDALESGFAASRDRATQAAARLSAARAPGAGRVEQALTQGDLASALRAARRHPHAEPRLRDHLRDALHDQLDAQAEARGITSPGLIDAPDVDADGGPVHPRASLELAETLYRDAAEGASARLTVARTSTAVPQEAGRYHPMHVGARSLEAIEDSPAYLKALLLRLQTLSTLAQHAAPSPARPERKKSKRKPRKKAVSAPPADAANAQSAPSAQDAPAAVQDAAAEASTTASTPDS